MPDAASTTPSYSSPRAFSMRVPMLPLIGRISMSGRRAISCAARRGLLVPRRAPCGSSSNVKLNRLTSTSRGSSRSVKAASIRPSGRLAGKSLALCTAKSISPFRSASSISLTNIPRSMLRSGAFLWRSPSVVMGTTTNSMPEKRDLKRRKTSSVCARERGLVLAPTVTRLKLFTIRNEARLAVYKLTGCLEASDFFSSHILHTPS